jgi:signal transduction histidine kinase
LFSLPLATKIKKTIAAKQCPFAGCSAFIKKIVGLRILLLMRKLFTCFLLFVLIRSAGFSQQMPDSNYINLTSFRDSTVIANKALLFFDSNNVANMGNLLQQHFVPLCSFEYKKYIRQKLVPKYAYLKIAVYNSDTAKKVVFCYPGNLFDNIKVYKQPSDTTLVFYQDASREGFAKLTLAPGEKSVFIFHLDFCRYDYNVLFPQLIRENYLNRYKLVYRIYRPRVEMAKIIGYITSGMLFIIILFVIANYFLHRKKEFLYYLGYAGFNFLLMLLLAVLNNITGSLSSFFNGYLDLVFLILSSIFYLAFNRHFLETKNAYRMIDKSFKIAELFLLFLLVLFSVVHYFTEWYFLESFLETLMKVILLGIGIFFIIFALKQKKKLLTYLAIGNTFAVCFSTISLLIILYDIKGPTIFYTAVFYYNTGIIFSLAFFLLGLTYKNRMELIENLKQQAALKLDMERRELESQITLIKAQQEERNRISADMHDDLGAGMTTIRLYSELAKNRLGSASVPEIEKISSSANELLTKMNAIIWSMSSSNDSLGNMVAYIRSYSLEYFENTGINCIISLPEEIPSLVVAGAIRRNVFLVVKETLNNILKHSGATEVRITLEIVSDGLKLFIHDNGKGIDFEKLRQFGNGLKNMKKRMEDVNIAFTIENKNGTLVTLHRVVTDFTPA